MLDPIKPEEIVDPKCYHELEKLESGLRNFKKAFDELPEFVKKKLSENE
tara:strand:+ start:539 stop:685 length:147 start_codon:yes stop_codon:yes gene_type:complete